MASNSDSSFYRTCYWKSIIHNDGRALLPGEGTVRCLPYPVLHALDGWIRNQPACEFWVLTQTPVNAPRQLKCNKVLTCHWDLLGGHELLILRINHECHSRNTIFIWTSVTFVVDAKGDLEMISANRFIIRANCHLLQETVIITGEIRLIPPTPTACVIRLP